MSVLERRLDATPIAIIDFETTGFHPSAGARVIEVAIVRWEPGREPELVLDTLIDPQSPVRGTRIHGITADDVEGAPLFSDVIPEIVEALHGAVIGAYNASFDLGFLDGEFQAAPRARGVTWTPPHLCLMWLRQGLEIGPRCRLGAACASLGLPEATHRAAEDAMAGAALWRHYLEVAEQRGMRTFGDLRQVGYRFTESFDNKPFDDGLRDRFPRKPHGTARKPRLEEPRLTLFWRPSPEMVAIAHLVERVDAVREYWHALVAAMADDLVSPDEIIGLRRLWRQLSLSPEDIRAVHAKYFADMLTVSVEDDVLTAEEATRLREQHKALRDIGWAPGDLSGAIDLPQ